MQMDITISDVTATINEDSVQSLVEDMVERIKDELSSDFDADDIVERGATEGYDRVMSDLDDMVEEKVRDEFYDFWRDISDGSKYHSTAQDSALDAIKNIVEDTVKEATAMYVLEIEKLTERIVALEPSPNQEEAEIQEETPVEEQAFYPIIAPDLLGIINVVNAVKIDIQNDIKRSVVEYWSIYTNARNHYNDNNTEG